MMIDVTNDFLMSSISHWST